MPTKSTASRRRRKPDRPTKPPGAPIWPHPAGYWCKKIGGRVVYFGAWRRRANGKYVVLPNNGQYQAAYARYKAEIDGIDKDIEAGRRPRTGHGYTNDKVTVADLCNQFLSSMLRKVERGERALSTYADYREAAALIVDVFGGSRVVESLEPQDFARLQKSMPPTWGLSRRGKIVRLTQTIFRYAKTNNLIQNEVAFGSDFEQPSKRTMRAHKNASEKRMFSPDEIRLILDALEGREVAYLKAGKSKRIKLKANLQLKAIVLLSINGGLGNTDLGKCRLSNIDLDAGWVDYPRSKTALPRKFPLWPETIKALKQHLAKRGEAKRPEAAQCVFLNRAGAPMVQEHRKDIVKDDQLVDVKIWRQDYISEQFSDLLKALGIKRRGVGFYGLRHTFATVGLQVGDRDAVGAIMGHANSDVLDGYDEEGPDDYRRKRVVTHVRNWLFGRPASKALKPPLRGR